MPNLIRIDDRYINLDYAHIDLDAETMVMNPDTGTYKSVPCVRITLIREVPGTDTNTRSSCYEYTGKQNEALKPWLQRVLEPLLLDSIDLPKPPKYKYQIVSPGIDTTKPSQESSDSDPF